MLLQRLVPITVEGVIRATYRTLETEERLLLARAPESWDEDEKATLMELKRRLYGQFLHVANLAAGNDALMEDIQRRDRSVTSEMEAATYLFMRLIERVYLERTEYPSTLGQAVTILKAELSEGECNWLMAEPLTEHGLLMRALVTWCVDRFGLEGNNTVLIDQINSAMRKDGMPYHPRTAARVIIQQLVLSLLASHPELAARLAQREAGKAGAHSRNN